MEVSRMSDSTCMKHFKMESTNATDYGKDSVIKNNLESFGENNIIPKINSIERCKLCNGERYIRTIIESGRIISIPCPLH